MSSARLVVRLTPRASQDRIDGWTTDGSGRRLLQARTTAPPTEGRANAALEKMIAKALGLPASAVAVTSGATSRMKTLRLEGVDEARAHERLGGPTP